MQFGGRTGDPAGRIEDFDGVIAGDGVRDIG
jgi:hypothetical protein